MKDFSLFESDLAKSLFQNVMIMQKKTKKKHTIADMTDSSHMTNFSPSFGALRLAWL